MKGNIFNKAHKRKGRMICNVTVVRNIMNGISMIIVLEGMFAGMDFIKANAVEQSFFYFISAVLTMEPRTSYTLGK